MTKKIVIVTALLLGLLAVWVFMEQRSAETVRPPNGVTNLIAFVEARPPSKIRKFDHNGKVHFEVVGTTVVSPLSLRSGPPTYVFDETGTLVDWTADRGDAPSFVRKWGRFNNAVPISVEDAKQLVKSRER